MKLKITLALFVLAAAGAAAYFLLGGPQQVAVAVVERGNAVDAVSANVTVTAQIDLTVRTEQAGRVVETLRAPGAAAALVAEGTVLARLDPRILEPQIERLKIEIRALKRQLEIGQPEELTLANLRQDLAANEARAERGNYPQSELAKERREVQRLERQISIQNITWETQLAQLERAKRQLELEIERTVIRAPISGTLASMATVTGDFLFEGDAVARLISPEVQIRASIAEEDFDGITVGQEVLLQFLGLEDRSFQGVISELLPTSDPQARRREVLVHLDALGEQSPLVAGMTGEASVIKERRDNAVVIPRRALFGDEVFVVSNGVVSRREVVPGFIGLKQAEIRQGLEAGEMVVIEDLRSVDDGDVVTPLLDD